MKQIEIDDIKKYKFISDISYSPDCGKAAFIVSQANDAQNGYNSKIMVLEKENKINKVKTSGNINGFIWTDDGHILVRAGHYKGNVDACVPWNVETAFYTVDVCKNEAQPGFSLPLYVRDMGLIREGVYWLTAFIDVHEPDYYLKSESEKAAIDERYESNTDYHILEQWPYWYTGSGFLGNRRMALFVYNQARDELIRVSGDKTFVRLVTVVDGKVYYAAEDYERCVDSLEDIWVYDPAAHTGRKIYGGKEFRVQKIQPYGGKLLLFAVEGKRYGICKENPWLYVMEPETGEKTVLKENEYAIGSSVVSDCRLGGGKYTGTAGRTVWYISTRRNAAHLLYMDENGGEQTVVGGEGTVEAFDVRPDGKEALFIGMKDGRLQELYRVVTRTGAVERLTHFNDAMLEDRYVAKYEKLTVRSDGYDIDGWVLRPKDFDPKKKYPAILDIHGGPKAVYGEVFVHEMQCWASKGFFVFFCNPFGGDGRGNEFTDIRGKYGTTDYRNLMDFTDAVLAAYSQIDAARICVTGGSYGGYMTNWIVGHTDRFVCAATQRSISNWISDFGTSESGMMFIRDQVGAYPWEDPEKLWDQSPMKFAGNIKTPLLFIHSNKDYCCNMGQALELYTALVTRGVPTRMVLFRGEGHELSRSGQPKHRVRRLEELTSWFVQYAGWS